MKKSILILSAVLLFAACSTESQKLTDIIPVQFIFSGDSAEIHVQDMFFAKDYSSFSLRSNPYLQTEYDTKNNIISLAADADFSGYTTLGFQFENQFYDIPVKIIRRRIVHFEYGPDRSANEVAVFGNFNFWLRKDLMMTQNNDGIFTLNIPFNPGQYEYLFYIDGKEILDPANPDSVPNGLGGYNSKLVVKPFFEGKSPFITPARVIEKSGKFIYIFHLLPGDHQNGFSIYDIVALADNKRLGSARIKIKKNTVRIKLKKSEAESSRRLRLAWSNGTSFSNVQDVLLEKGRPADGSGQFRWQDAVIYSIMPDRFIDGDPSNNNPVRHGSLADKANWQGGDLAGIISTIDEGYFEKMGVNTLWILPILQTVEDAYRETPPPHRWFTGYHGYWPVKARTVDPHFGDNAMFSTLMDVAHQRNLKILLDFVSNHVHENHSYYQDHPEWFGEYVLPDGRKNLRLFDEYRLTTWFDSYLPSFNYLASQEAIDSSVADAVWWMKKYDLDGFRHDAVKHVPNRFWRDLTRAIRLEFPKKDVYQIGETFGDHSLIASYVNNGQLSSQFNFNLYWPARMAFADSKTGFDALATEMETVCDVYGQLHTMGNLMDSHDQPRFAAYLEGDLGWGEDAAEVGWNRDIQVDNPLTYQKIAVYMTYLMTIPGPPVIYYGDEVGMTGAADPDNRRVFDQSLNDHQKKLRETVAALTALRSKHPALRYGDYMTLLADETCYAWLRSDFNEKICSIVHKGRDPRIIRIKLPKGLALDNYDLLKGNTDCSIRDNVLEIHAKPWSAYVLKLN